jgi:hypothetical protein
MAPPTRSVNSTFAAPPDDTPIVLSGPYQARSVTFQLTEVPTRTEARGWIYSTSATIEITPQQQLDLSSLKGGTVKIRWTVGNTAVDMLNVNFES